jgi:hypothetical protein
VRNWVQRHAGRRRPIPIFQIDSETSLLEWINNTIPTPNGAQNATSGKIYFFSFLPVIFAIGQQMLFEVTGSPVFIFVTRLFPKNKSHYEISELEASLCNRNKLLIL